MINNITEVTLRTEVMTKNIYNTSAPTVPSFRISCIIAQLKHNGENCANPAISKIILDIVNRLSSNMVNVEGEGAYTEHCLFFCDRALDIIEESRVFLSQLIEVMRIKSYDYDVVKYTVSVLDQKEYVLGTDDGLDEPEE